jgi:hypothetical protein
MKRLSSSANRLFELTRGQDEPDELARNRVARALAVKIATGAGTVAAGASVAKAAVGLGAIAAKSTIVLGITGTLVTAGWLATRPARPAAPPMTAPAQIVRVAPPTPVVMEEPVPVAPAPEATRAVGKSAPRKLLRPVVQPEPSPVVAPKAEDELRPETEALRLAQQALRDKAPLQALKLLDAQDLRFRGGLLNQERAAMRVLALCQAGRIDEARVHATRFEQLWPRSALLGRVRSACWVP